MLQSCTVQQAMLGSAESCCRYLVVCGHCSHVQSCAVALHPVTGKHVQVRCDELQGDLDACLDTLETDRTALSESQTLIHQLQVRCWCCLC